MPKSIPPPSFWSEEQAALWEAFAPLVAGVLMAGADAGAEVLPSGISVLVDWDVVNESAISYLRQYRLGVMQDIGETTRRQAVAAITDWIESGAALPELDAALTPVFGATRAKMIATTEVTRAYADGNQMAWESAGVVGGKKWQTLRDERTCPICGPLHNVTVALSGMFEIGGEGSGNFIAGPPAHPRCRCYTLPVVDFDAVSAERRRELGLI